VREEVEAGIDRLVEMGGAVILGRAASIVLATHPMAFHVRLDGPVEARVAKAMEIEGVDEQTARQRQTETDRARARYVSRLYSRDPADPRLYHLVLDSTALPSATVVDIIATASVAFWRRSGD
jgi:cytidylate kinase